MATINQPTPRSGGILTPRIPRVKDPDSQKLKAQPALNAIDANVAPTPLQTNPVQDNTPATAPITTPELRQAPDTLVPIDAKPIPDNLPWRSQNPFGGSNLTPLTPPVSFGEQALNAAQQTGRIVGGVAQGTLKAASAIPVLTEAVYNANAPLAPTAVIDPSSAAQIEALGGNIADAGQFLNFDVEFAPQTSNAISNAVGKANTSIQNWTNSWVPAPITPVAETVATIADAAGEAVPAVATALATGGSGALFSGTVASRLVGASNAATTNIVEQDGDLGTALLAGGIEYATEAVGGRVFDANATRLAEQGVKVIPTALNIGGEGVEEVMAGGAYSLATGQEYTPEQALNDAIIGSAVGGIIQTGISTANAISDLAGRTPETSNTQAIQPETSGEIITLTDNSTQNVIEFVPQSDAVSDAPAVEDGGKVLTFQDNNTPETGVPETATAPDGANEPVTPDIQDAPTPPTNNILTFTERSPGSMDAAEPIEAPDMTGVPEIPMSDNAPDMAPDFSEIDNTAPEGQSLNLNELIVRGDANSDALETTEESNLDTVQPEAGASEAGTAPESNLDTNELSETIDFVDPGISFEALETEMQEEGGNIATLTEEAVQEETFTLEELNESVGIESETFTLDELSESVGIQKSLPESVEQEIVTEIVQNTPDTNVNTSVVPGSEFDTIAEDEGVEPIPAVPITAPSEVVTEQEQVTTAPVTVPSTVSVVTGTPANAIGFALNTSAEVQTNPLAQADTQTMTQAQTQTNTETQTQTQTEPQTQEQAAREIWTPLETATAVQLRDRDRPRAGTNNLFIGQGSRGQIDVTQGYRNTFNGLSSG